MKTFHPSNNVRGGGFYYDDYLSTISFQHSCGKRVSSIEINLDKGPVKLSDIADRFDSDTKSMVLSRQREDVKNYGRIQLSLLPLYFDPTLIGEKVEVKVVGYSYDSHNECLACKVTFEDESVQKLYRKEEVLDFLTLSSDKEKTGKDMDMLKDNLKLFLPNKSFTLSGTLSALVKNNERGVTLVDTAEKANDYFGKISEEEKEKQKEPEEISKEKNNKEDIER